jgi:ankyrin repeat protein
LLQSIDPRFQTQVANSLKWLAFSNREWELEDLAIIFILRPEKTIALDENERLFRSRDVLKYLSGLVVADVRFHYPEFPEFNDDFESYSPIPSIPDSVASGKSDHEAGHEARSRTRSDAESQASWESGWESRVGSGEYVRSKPKQVTYVRLAHFSIKEYLVSDRIKRGAAGCFAFSETDAHWHIAHSCLAYHLHRSAGGYPKNEKGEWPYLDAYAAEEWPTRLELFPRESWPQDVAIAAARALSMGSPSLYETMRRARDNKAPHFQWSRFRKDFPFQYPGRIWRPLCFTAQLGFFHLTDMLIDSMSREYLTQEDLDIALVEAAFAGSTAVVGLLLERGASVDGVGSYKKTALQTAAYAGHAEVVEQLLDRGADINGQGDGSFGSALQAACAAYHTHTVKLLVGRGANVKQAPTVSGSVLTSTMNDQVSTLVTIASLAKLDSVSIEIQRFLLDSGADVNIDCGTITDHGPPLHAAARFWGDQSYSLLKLFLERGADVNGHGGKYGYPLQGLCSHPAWPDHNTLDEIELLLSKGADVNARGGMYGSALQAACCHNHLPIDGSSVVELLLDRGADPHARGGHFETVLQAACTSSDYAVDMVRLLLERGVDVHAQGGYFGNALQASCYHGNEDMAKLLLDLGADVNASGGQYGSALQAAAASTAKGGDDVLRLLLRKGADVNQQGGRHGTALQAAALLQNLNRVLILLEHGADVNIEGGEHSTALQAACTTKDLTWNDDETKIALLLLEHGANVHAQGGEFGSAWHAAASRKSPEWEAVLQLMLDRGVDINDARGRRHATALQAVLEIPPAYRKSQRKRRIRFLLDRGADINIQAGQYGFPLQSACCREADGTSNPLCCDAISPIQYLLDKCPDLDINAQGGLFGTALQAAAYNGLARVVEALLQHGAHVNPPRSGKYGSPLNAAVVRGCWNIVKVLMDAGATPDCQQLPAPDEEWLARVREEHGWGAVQRYRVFWDRHRLKKRLRHVLH